MVRQLAGGRRENYCQWVFPFYPTPLFEHEVLNEIGLRVAHASDLYPDTPFEWLPWDVVMQHMKMLKCTKCVDDGRKRKRSEEEEDAKKKRKD